MHMVDENYTALVNHAIGILVTNGAYILDPRFGSRLLNGIILTNHGHCKADARCTTTSSYIQVSAALAISSVTHPIDCL